MDALWLGLAVLILSGPLLVALVAFRRRSAPDDTVALRLAAALDGTPPELVDRALMGLCHRVAFRWDDAPHELWIGEHGGMLRRNDAHAGHAARLFSAARQGRAQEDYLGGRSLIPDADGWTVVHGEPGLRGWETRIPAGFRDSLRAAQIDSVAVDRTHVSVYVAPVDLNRVEAVLSRLSELAVSFHTS
ncbi:MAG: hypothetical protein AB8I08_08785 [Sandaracinaceae bacterium]